MHARSDGLANNGRKEGKRFYDDETTVMLFFPRWFCFHITVFLRREQSIDKMELCNGFSEDGRVTTRWVWVDDVLAARHSFYVCWADVFCRRGGVVRPQISRAAGSRTALELCRHVVQTDQATR